MNIQTSRQTSFSLRKGKCAFLFLDYDIHMLKDKLPVCTVVFILQRLLYLYLINHHFDMKTNDLSCCYVMVSMQKCFSTHLHPCAKWCIISAYTRGPDAVVMHADFCGMLQIFARDWDDVFAVFTINITMYCRTQGQKTYWFVYASQSSKVTCNTI